MSWAVEYLWDGEEEWIGCGQFYYATEREALTVKAGHEKSHQSWPENGPFRPPSLRVVETDNPVNATVCVCCGRPRELDS
jgi:hypothetical protein